MPVREAHRTGTDVRVDGERPVRLNLGAGGYPLDGFTNIDLFPPADIVGDFMEMSFAELKEVVMIHVLEHISHRNTLATLERVRSWMKPGARLVVEVPDMGMLMAAPRERWLTDIYGVQTHDGEYHRAGFTFQTLRKAMRAAGFHDVAVRSFLSDHPRRTGFPCLEATGCA
jgi:predicted SAM-dependent methyltransferase